MLVLTRQKYESITIGDGPNMIEVTIVDIRGDKVRLGITGPKGIAVHRREVFDAIQRQKLATNGDDVTE
jgi:carbon storage regulator